MKRAHEARRRQVLTAALLMAALPAARAQPSIQRLGIFSLLGDVVRVVAREVQEVLFKDVGMDDIAGGVARAAVQERFPQAVVSLHRAPKQQLVDEQRAIATAAQRGDLPDWVVQAAREASLSHLLLITSHVGAMEFKTALAQVVGNSRVAGIGFYVSADGRVSDSRTGAVSSGYLAPFVQLRLTLLDAASRSVVASTNLSEGFIVGPPFAEAPNPWEFMTRAEKAQALQQLLKSNMARGMEAVLKLS